MNRTTIVRAVRKPKAAAVAGLAFGLMLGAVLMLVQSVAPESGATADDWMNDPNRRDAISAALALIPFAGIAFIWFIAVVRTELGRREDRFFDTVFVSSGLLFVAMLFTAAAVLSGVLYLQSGGATLAQGVAGESWALASALLGQFGARMAAVFAIVVSTAGRRVGSLPRSIAVLGYACGLVLLLTPPMPDWAVLAFPLWVIALSLLVLFRRDTPVENPPVIDPARRPPGAVGD